MLTFSVFYLCVQEDDSFPQKQDTSKVVMDGVDERQRDKHANDPTNFRPTFYRPFLDLEDSAPPEKLYKLSDSEVQNGMYATPVHIGALPAVVQKTSVCGSKVKSSDSTVEGSVHGESGKLDERRLCERELRDEDAGRDRRLNAALGLISLADVSSDVTSSTDTTDGDRCDG